MLTYSDDLGGQCVTKGRSASEGAARARLDATHDRVVLRCGNLGATQTSPPARRFSFEERRPVVHQTVPALQEIWRHDMGDHVGATSPHYKHKMLIIKELS